MAECLAGARVALVKSGTGSLEACVHGVPTVVFYRMRNRLQEAVYNVGLDVPFIGAANLVMAREVAPEHCFAGDDAWARVAADVERLWRDGPDRERALDDLAALRLRMGAPGAARRAAAWVRAALTRTASA